MSNNKDFISVLVINQAEITAHHIQSATATIEQSITLPYGPDTLTQTLQQIKKELAIDHARLLLPEDSVYVLLTKIPTQVSNIDNEIKQEIQTLIPEQIEELIYDYRIVYADEKEQQLQIFATHKDNITSLEESLSAAGLTITTVESPSIAAARLTQDEPEPHVILMGRNPMIATVAYRGAVIEAITIQENQTTEKHITHLLSFVKREYGVQPKYILYSEYNETLPNIAKTTKLDIKKADINPILSLFHKNVSLPDHEQISLKLSTPKTETKDEKITKEKKVIEPIVITPPQKTKDPVEPKPRTQPKTKPETIERRKLPMLAFVIPTLVILLGIAAYFLIQAYQNQSFPFTPEPTPTATPTPLPTATPSPSPAPTVEPSPTPLPIPARNTISVEILNGGGQPGAAGNLSDFLENKGYSIANTGNAQYFNYTITEIRLKQSKASIQETLINDIRERYNTAEYRGTLDESSPFDAQIIIGN